MRVSRPRLVLNRYGLCVVQLSFEATPVQQRHAAMDLHSNLFVKNIPTEINEAVLRSLFQTYGTVVSCRILKSRYRGSNNVGFIKFAKLEDAQLAMQYMHLATVQNVVIEVRFADQDVGERHLDADGVYETGDTIAEAYEFPRQNLYIKGFPRQWREQDLMDFFANFGTVMNARVLSSRESSGRSGAGFVMMASPDEAAIAMRHTDGRIPYGGEVAMRVKYAETEIAMRSGKSRKQLTTYESRYTPYVSERKTKKRLYGTKQKLPLIPVLTQAAILSSSLCPVIGQQFKLDREDFPAEIKQEPEFQELSEPAQATDNHPYETIYPIAPHVEPEFEEEPTVVKDETPVQERTSLYIRNLPHDVDELRLYELFGHYGGVLSVKRLPDRDSKSRGGVGFVNYVHHEDASQAAAEMDGVRLGNNILMIALQVKPTYSR